MIDPTKYSPTPDYEERAIRPQEGREFFLHLYVPAHEQHGLTYREQIACCRVKSVAAYVKDLYWLGYNWPWSEDPPTLSWVRYHRGPGSVFRLVENDGSCQWPNGEIIRTWVD